MPFLEAGHYWATDASRALMLRGREEELDAPDRLPEDHLIGDDGFRYPGVPPGIDFAISFAVFTHLPADRLGGALDRARIAFPALRAFLFTVFLGRDGAGPVRQADGVVTHPDRPPWHISEDAVRRMVEAAGFDLGRRDDMLPRGQVCFVARPAR
ncbi:hypothetical protein ACK8OR_16140 [Jannaschia sp. KMU-145]|uniref:hypothetical protein n=1 Tax=Jannaschia halovivens TaxID=3388667 RepID=UPI00396B20C5